MFQRIPVMIGQYRPFSSHMHTIDTRVKILPILLVLTLILCTSSILFYVIMLLLLIALLSYSGLNITIVKENLKPLLFFVLFTAGYHILFSGKETEILFSLFNLSLYKGALFGALFYSLRLVLFLLSAFFITLTCSPSELAEAVTKLLKPLKILKFPLSDFSLILFIALRFIPILYEEFYSIQNAQKLRGVKFSGSLVSKMLHLKSILIPLFLSAIRRADQLSEALMVRGYNSKNNRTFYSMNKLTIKDVGFLMLTLIFITSIFYLIG